MEFVYLLIILIISAGFSLLLKIKSEQSIFLTICMFFIIMFLSGLISTLSIGYYIIISLAIISVLYIILKVIKKDIKLLSLITPGTVFFLIAFTVYYFSTRNAVLHLWDEATHWGTSAKKMFYMRDLWTSGLQSIASPVFNQVMLYTTGFKESALYLSQWTLFLACISLPMSSLKWKRCYIAFAFGIAGVLIASTIINDGNLSLYADGILGMLFAGLALEWYLEHDRSPKRYIWALPGLFVLVQLKNGSGASLSAMFIVYALVIDYTFKKSELSPTKMYLSNILTLGALGAALALSQYLLIYFDRGYAGIASTSQRISPELTSSIFFIVFLAIFFLTLSFFMVFSVNIFKRKTNTNLQKLIKKLLIIFSCITFVLIIGISFYIALLRPGFDVRTTFINYFLAFQKTKILNISVMYLIAIIVLFYTINIILAPKTTKKRYLIFYVTALILSGTYLYGILYAYMTSFSLGEAVNTASFDRYVGTALIFSGMFAFMPLISCRQLSLKKKYITLIPIFLAIILIGFQFRPAYTVARTTRKEALIFRQTEINGAEYVKDKIGTDHKVFLVIQQDQGFVFNWMRYEFAPIATNGGYWSFGQDGGWNFAWNSDRLREFLQDANYDYLYLFDSNDYFAENFSPLFGENEATERTLYKFTYDEATALVPVD